MTEAWGRFLGIVKTTYNFFTGDAIVLSMVVVAFVAAYVLEHTLHQHLVAGVVFVGLIVASITLTLGRERAATQRQQRRGG